MHRARLVVVVDEATGWVACGRAEARTGGRSLATPPMLSAVPPLTPRRWPHWGKVPPSRARPWGGTVRMSRWPRAMPSCARAPCFLCRTMPVHLSRAGPLCLPIVLARRRCLPHGAVPSSTIRDAVSRTDEPRRLVGGDGGGRQSLLQRHARSLRGATGTGRQAFPAPSGPASQLRGQTSRGGKKCHGLRLGGVFWRSIPPSGHGGGSHPPRDLHTNSQRSPPPPHDDSGMQRRAAAAVSLGRAGGCDAATNGRRPSTKPRSLRSSARPRESRSIAGNAGNAVARGMSWRFWRARRGQHAARAQPSTAAACLLRKVSR